jgi:hypothetical protein
MSLGSLTVLGNCVFDVFELQLIEKDLDRFLHISLRLFGLHETKPDRLKYSLGVIVRASAQTESTPRIVQLLNGGAS